MNTDTFSVRLDRSAKAGLQKLAKGTGRSRTFLAAEAISAYLDTNEWQVAGITKALSSLKRGKGVAHARVSEWVASWERAARHAYLTLGPWGTKEEASVGRPQPGRAAMSDHTDSMAEAWRD